MPKQMNDGKNDFSQINNEKLEQAITNCDNMLNYISNSAADIVTDIIYNNPCPEARQFFIDKPEELAIRAYKKVLEELEQMNAHFLTNNFH